MRTMVLVAVALVAFFAIDTFLAAMDRSQSRLEARRLYEDGERLLKSGDGAAASEQFRAALFIARDNEEYQLALAEAQAAAGQLSDAESTLAELLGRDADGGAVNLAMARVLAKEGRETEAFSYYHRAIYGQWRQNADENRLKVRFELVDLLVARHATGGLLAELLPLEEEAPGDLATRMKLGHLFIAAGAPARGAAVFHELLREKPRDPDIWAGLGDADFAQGNYRTAAADYQSALRYRPGDAAVSQRAEVCSEVLALDPSQRGLGADEQYRRSVKILGLILQNASGCAIPPDLADAAAKAEKQHVYGSRQAAAYEENLDLADKIWQVRKSGCGPQTAPVPEYLTLTLNLLAQ